MGDMNEPATGGGVTRIRNIERSSRFKKFVFTELKNTNTSLTRENGQTLFQQENAYDPSTSIKQSQESVEDVRKNDASGARGPIQTLATLRGKFTPVSFLFRVPFSKAEYWQI